MTDGLTHGPLPSESLHVCVDMQRLFGPGSAWSTPWLPRVLPRIARICAHQPERTLFTRFIPAARPGEGRGTWKHYYERWSSMTLEQLDPTMLELMPPLQRFAPPGQVLDKRVYSPWHDGVLEAQLRRQGTEALIVTGGETDVCVLATVLGAVDRGFRTILVSDCLCSSSDETHDAMMTLYRHRFGVQIETVTTDRLLDHWR